MTKHTDFSAPGNEGDNLLSFSNASDAPHPGEDPARDHQRPDGMPDGFQLLEDGIYQDRPGDGDDMLPERICSPVIVIARCRRPDGSDWGRVVQVKDPEGNWHKVVLEQRDVAKKTAKVLDELCTCGLDLAPAGKAGQAVKDLLAAWCPSKVHDRVTHLGWTDKSHRSFVLGSGRVLGDANVVVEATATDVGREMHAKGTLEGWRDNLARLASGNPLMILALSHAFTGPLLSVLDRDGGGFHLRGASSSGKTKILRAATSVWGGPSFMQSWRSTDNGLEGVAAACSHSLLVLDELHQVDPKVAGEVTYMLANGRGKSRSSAGGRNQVTQCWTVPVLSSGEISLEAHMASGGRSIKEGQEVRLIDLSAECRRHRAFDTLHEVDSGDAFAKRIQHAIETDYGVAGPAFVEKLMTCIDQVGPLANRFRNHLKNSKRVAELSEDGQVSRVLDRFVLAALAGEMATQFGLTGWHKGEALHAARDLFIIWLEARDLDTQAEVAAALERTRCYVQAHPENFVRLGQHDGHEADGWRDAEWIYVRPACWKRIHGANGHDKAARLHRSAGSLRSQQGEGLQFRMGREVEGRPRVYAVRASAVLAA